MVMFLGLFWRLYAGALIDGFRRKDIFLGINFFAALIIIAVASLGFVIDAGYAEGHVYKTLIHEEAMKLAYVAENGVETGFQYFGILDPHSGLPLGEQLPTILPILVFASTLFAYFIHFPNLFAFVQELSDKNNYQKYARMIEVYGQITVMISGCLTGVLMNGGMEFINWTFIPWSIHEIFLLNGLAFVISFVIILFIKYEKKKEEDTTDERAKAEKNSEPVTVMESLKLGYDFLKENKLVFFYSLVSSAIFITYMAMVWTILPAYIKGVLNSNEGVMGAAELFLAIGALVCGLLLQRIFRNLGNAQSIFILSMLVGICYFMLNIQASISGVSGYFLLNLGFAEMTVNRGVLLLLILGILIGFGNAGARIYRVVYLMKAVPNKYIGRVQSILTIPQTLLPVIFALIFSLDFFKDANVSYAFMILGIFTIFCAILVFSVRKKIDSKEG